MATEGWPRLTIGICLWSRSIDWLRGDEQAFLEDKWKKMKKEKAEQDEETHTLPRLTTSLTLVTGFVRTTAIGVRSLRLPSITSTPTTIGSFLLNTAT